MTVKSRRFYDGLYVTRMGKTYWKEPFGKPRRNWKDNKINFRKTHFGDGGG
jgi:hypothetical protein